RDATESQMAEFEVSSGQPVNVMSMAAERSNVDRVEIPKGLQNIPESGPVTDGPAVSAGLSKAAAPGVAAGAGDTTASANLAPRATNASGKGSPTTNQKPPERAIANRVTESASSRAVSPSPRETAILQRDPTLSGASERVAENASALRAPANSPKNPV